MVTVQCDNGMDSCLVFMAEPTTFPGHCKTFLEAGIIANNAHPPGCKVRSLESSSDENDEQVGSGVVRVVRCCWTWQIVAKMVQCPKESDGFEMHQTAITLV